MKLGMLSATILGPSRHRRTVWTPISRRRTDMRPRNSAGYRHLPPKCINDQESEKNGDLSDASRLLGHTDKRITETVYRRVGEIVKPTR